MSKYLQLMTEMPDLLQAAFPETVFYALNIWNTWVLNVVVLCWVIWKSLEGLNEKSISRQMPRSQMSWKNLEILGSNQRHLADRKILRFINSAKITTTKQICSLVNFRRMPFQSTQKTTEDVDNGHSKECRSFDVLLVVDLHCAVCSTFKIRFRAVYTQAYGGACRRDRTRNTQLPNADTIDFFFWSDKRGVRPHPPNPPWLRAWSYMVLSIEKNGSN